MDSTLLSTAITFELWTSSICKAKKIATISVYFYVFWCITIEIVLSCINILFFKNIKRLRDMRSETSQWRRGIKYKRDFLWLRFPLGESFFFMCSFWCWGTAWRWVPPLNTQWLQILKWGAECLNTKFPLQFFFIRNIAWSWKQITFSIGLLRISSYHEAKKVASFLE